MIAEYLPPATKAGCCAGCASPAERALVRRRGAELITRAAAGRSGAARGGLAGDADPLIWWPGDIKALAKQVDTEITAIARDYSQAIKSWRINHIELENFKAFFNEFAKYRDGLGFTDWYTGSTATALQNFQRRANAFRDILRARGATVASPGANVPTPTDWSGVAKWAAAGAIVLGGAMALGHVAKFLPTPRAA